MSRADASSAPQCGEFAFAVANIIQYVTTHPDDLDQVTSELRRILQTIMRPPGQPERLQECVTIDQIESRLRKRHFDKPMEVTTAVARALAGELKLEPPKREEKRQRPLLLEWFRRNWNAIEPNLDELAALDKDEQEIKFSSSSDDDDAASGAGETQG